MAFLDDLSKKISSCADKAADKAKDLAEIGKLSCRKRIAKFVCRNRASSL